MNYFSHLPSVRSMPPRYATRVDLPPSLEGSSQTTLFCDQHSSVFVNVIVFNQYDDHHYLVMGVAASKTGVDKV